MSNLTQSIKRYGAVELWTFWPNTPTIEGEIIAHKDSMMTMRRATLFSFALFVGATLYAQVSDLPPFVSRLTAVTSNDGVFLSWQDNDEAEGNYKVYRHTEEISESNIADARLLSAVEPGVQEYTDTPTTEGPHYYAVLASSAEGEEYLFFVPYRNKTTRGIRFAITVVAEKVIAPIADISAEVDDEVVMLKYTATSGEDIVIYRSTETIGSADGLINAVLIETTTRSESPFMDRPLAGIFYYYGVFYNEALRTGQAIFEPGNNILLIPVQIPLAAAPEITTIKTAIRVRPLPYLMLSSTIDSGEMLKAGPYAPTVEAIKLSAETSAAVEKLLSGKTRDDYGVKQAAWFTPKNGSDLEELLIEPFEERDWEKGLDIIGSFMQTRRTTIEEQRSHFYKGQCLYFLKRYKEAFMEFIFAEDASYTQVQPWLDDIIALLASR